MNGALRQDRDIAIPQDGLSKAEQQLFKRVQRWNSHAEWRDLNATALAEIAFHEGIDFAATLLYVRLRESVEQGPLIQQLEKTPNSDVCEFSSDFRVGLVPGGCHKESLDSRDCLRLVFDEITRLGFDAEILPTTSFGSILDNAKIISTWLNSPSDTQTILVSLSKGGAEVKLSLHEEPQAFQHVPAWIDASGLLDGSEWVTWLLDRRVSWWGARCWSWYWGYPFSTLEQLRRGADEVLDFDVTIPDHLTAIRIVGFPLTGDLSHHYSKRSFQRLTPRGPSDGMGIMLGDLTRWRGLIYPVWRADHFLRPAGRNMRDFVGEVLRYVAGVA